MTKGCGTSSTVVTTVHRVDRGAMFMLLLVVLELSVCTVQLCAAWGPTPGFPNQLGKTPMLGWRSWQAYAGNVDQDLMEMTMEGLAKKRPLGPGGKLMSLLDAGYRDVGLDSGYEQYRQGVNGSCHGADHHMLINATRFPSFVQMNDKAHSLGLTTSWYLNSDGCPGENEPFVTYVPDSQDAVKYGFDGVKFDTERGGPNHNITEWAVALNATGKQMMIENCLDKHPTYLLTDPNRCPFNFYRSGPDNSPNFLGGINHVYFWAQPFLNTSVNGLYASRPGCFAYPDMLGIGAPVEGSNARKTATENGCNPMTIEEERTLFANWAIVSSPLVLGLDPANDTVVEKYWDILTNERALTINADWAGEPGMMVKTSTEMFEAVAYVGATCEEHGNKTLPHWLVYRKILGNKSFAALAINVWTEPQSFDVSLSDLLSPLPPPSDISSYTLTDVWTNKELAQKVSVDHPWHIEALAPHNSIFVIATPHSQVAH